MFFGGFGNPLTSAVLRQLFWIFDAAPRGEIVKKTTLTQPRGRGCSGVRLLFTTSSGARGRERTTTASTIKIS